MASKPNGNYLRLPIYSISGFSQTGRQYICFRFNVVYQIMRSTT